MGYGDKNRYRSEDPIQAALDALEDARDELARHRRQVTLIVMGGAASVASGLFAGFAGWVSNISGGRLGPLITALTVIAIVGAICTFIASVIVGISLDERNVHPAQEVREAERRYRDAMAADDVTDSDK